MIFYKFPKSLFFIYANIGLWAKYAQQFLLGQILPKRNFDSIRDSSGSGYMIDFQGLLS